jgi:4-diphosphocytidyl-2-C-methyl-D-erythritol kinase
VERAIEAMRSRLGLPQAFEAHVLKAIPMGAGLGGGSSDAAAAIMAVNELYGPPLTTLELAEVAAGLGADVAFFLQGGTAIARGRGEVIEPLLCPQTLWWVIAMPDEGLSTAGVYQRYDEMAPAPTPQTLEKLITALAAGDINAIGRHLHNDLEVAAFDLRPELADLKSDLLTLGATGAVMTGSGSALAALCPNPEAAESLADRLEAQASFIRVTGSLPVSTESI